MRTLRSLAAVLAIFLPTTLAVFADEAYQIDYHHALLGIPIEGSTFIHQPVASSKASLIYTLTEKGYIGALNPKDGSVVWRQQLGRNETTGVLRASGDVAVTGYGNQLRAWGASDGKLAWSQEVDGQLQVKDVQFLEAGDGSPDADVVVLAHGSHITVERRDGTTGAVKWKHTVQSLDIPHQLGLTASGVYLVSLHGALLGGYKIKVTQLDLESGKKSGDTVLVDSDVAGAEDVLFVGSSKALPILAWTDKSFKNVRINLLGNKAVVTRPVDTKDEEMEGIKIIASRSPAALPHFLIQYTGKENHWAEVFHLDPSNGTIGKAHSLPKMADKGAFAASATEERVYFSRVVKGAITVTSSVSESVMERHLFQVLVPGTFGNPVPLFAVTEVLPRPGGRRAAVRIAFLLTSGDFALFLNELLAWSRPESLTLAETASFAELAQGERLAKELEIEEHASIPAAYIHRVKRHIRELQSLPEWLKQQPTRIMLSIKGIQVNGGLTEKPDKFGLSKIVIVATRNGRIIAIDTAAGGLIAWNQYVRDYSDGKEWKVPTIVTSTPGIIRVKSDTKHWVYSMDGHLLREGKDTKSKSPAKATVTYDIVDGQLKGFAGPDKSAAIWSFSPKKGERILSVTARPAADPVSSIGIVLGDRRVLYKYLNPNLALVVSLSDSADTTTASLIDTASGNVLHSASHRSVDTAQPIAAAVSENWLAYSYTLKSSPLTPSRGSVLVTAHLFESAQPDDRGPLGAAGNYSAHHPLPVDAGTPYVISQSYQISEEISHLSVTHTRQGITSRMLLAVLPHTAGIVGIPLQVIDPRRPVGRDPTSSEQMEGLTRYHPVIEFNPQWYLNHQREVVGTEKIVTAPAVLESTSLIVAIGHDVFGTRVTPSGQFDVLGKSFNKVQMLGTVAALFVGVVVVAPLVKRKQINMRWQL